MSCWSQLMLLFLTLVLAACSGSIGFDDDMLGDAGDDRSSLYRLLVPPDITFLRSICTDSIAIDEQEPNDTAINSQSVLIPLDECFVIMGIAANRDDIDIYRLTLEEPQIIELALTSDVTANFDLILESETEGQTIISCGGLEGLTSCGVSFTGMQDNLFITVMPIDSEGDYMLLIKSSSPEDL